MMPDTAAERDDATLPPIPTPLDLASDRLVHRWSDLLFNPPGIQNELGQAQSTRSICGLQAITFPPLISNTVEGNRWNKAYTATCELMLDGRLASSFPAGGGDIAYTWYPHLLVREATIDGVFVRTESFMPPRRCAVVQSIMLTNPTDTPRQGTVAWILRAGVSRVQLDPWPTRPPSEADNVVTQVEAQGCLVFHARHSDAVSVQGLRPAPAMIAHGIQSVHTFAIAPGEHTTFTYVHVLAEDAERGLAEFAYIQTHVDALKAETLERWSARLRNAFTPYNDEFSGHLPVLLTRDRSLWKLYHVALLSMLASRVDAPHAAVRPAYRSIGARYHQTAAYWPWDMGLLGLGIALLDPSALRQMVELWCGQDPHAHSCLNYLTGTSFGDWYAANSMSLVQAAEAYLRVTGDVAWLDTLVGSQTVLDHLLGFALHWKAFDQGDGLADYSASPLLEVVGTYTGAVAAINIGNVYALRYLAVLLDGRGDRSRAEALRKDATQLARRIIDVLYVDGAGYWRCRRTDGGFNEVRHSYDVLTALAYLSDDLSARQRSEMHAFFWRELYTPHWMRALSAYDVDASWNVRADHSWCGSYPMWPAKMAQALYGGDDPDRVSSWVRGLAATANQGVFGQAHLDDTIFPAEAGGARKCPPEVPFENEFCSLAGGAFLDLIIGTIFGADLSPLDGLRVERPHVAQFDPDARLVNLRYRDQLYTVAQGHAALQHGPVIF